MSSAGVFALADALASGRAAQLECIDAEIGSITAASGCVRAPRPAA